ncbi:MAG: 3-dehydroquinate synthase [Gemmatimonadales bacterium]
MTPAEPVVVTHTLGSYPVYVETGGLGRLDQLVSHHLPNRRLVMIADATVHELYRAGRMGAPTWNGETLTFPAGERSKSRGTWASLSDGLLERGFGRDSGVIALGGGVTGDLAGFVAATYMRGLPYLQVPTTLLAMLDASVGGKTGVDTPRGKNLIGAFHPPAAVVADPLTLTTLPEREYRAGLAEAVKHGLIADQAYFEWMEEETERLTRRHPAALTRLVRRSIEIKAEVVSDDERESGRRAILNAGHTVGHALEQVSNYQISHGEAVALGLVVECALSEQLGIAPPGLRQRVAGLLSRLGLPERLPEGLGPAELLGSMSHDKKNREARIHFALPAGLGQMHRESGWTTPVPADAIRAAMGHSAPPR